MPVINPAAAYRYETSKAAQALLFERLGLPYPRTAVFNDPGQAAKLAADFRFPVVVKPNVGGSGAGIVRFDTSEALEAAARAGALGLGPDGVALVQEYLTPADGGIVRVEVLGGQYLYAIKIFREPSAGYNLCPADICRPGEPAPPDLAACPADAPRLALRVERHEPGRAIVEAAVAIMRAARIDVGGVEYLVDRDGRVHYYDVNATSNFVADAPALLGFDPTARFADYIEAVAAGARPVSAPPRRRASRPERGQASQSHDPAPRRPPGEDCEIARPDPILPGWRRRSGLPTPRRLLAVSQAVGSTLELREVVRRTTRALVRALGADAGGAWALEPGQARLMAARRLPRPAAVRHRPRGVGDRRRPSARRGGQAGGRAGPRERQRRRPPLRPSGPRPAAAPLRPPPADVAQGRDGRLLRHRLAARGSRVHRGGAAPGRRDRPAGRGGAGERAALRGGAARAPRGRGAGRRGPDHQRVARHRHGPPAGDGRGARPVRERRGPAGALGPRGSGGDHPVPGR